MENNKHWSNPLSGDALKQVNGGEGTSISVVAYCLTCKARYCSYDKAFDHKKAFPDHTIEYYRN